MTLRNTSVGECTFRSIFLCLFLSLHFYNEEAIEFEFNTVVGTENLFITFLHYLESTVANNQLMRDAVS